MGRRRMMFLGACIIIIGTVISITAFGPGAPSGNVGGFVQFIIGRVSLRSTPPFHHSRLQFNR